VAKLETPRDLKGKKLLVPHEVFPKVTRQAFQRAISAPGEGQAELQRKYRAPPTRPLPPRGTRGSGRAAGGGGAAGLSLSTHPPAVPCLPAGEGACILCGLAGEGDRRRSCARRRLAPQRLF
jgi:hypothetical protein